MICLCLSCKQRLTCSLGHYQRFNCKTFVSDKCPEQSSLSLNELKKVEVQCHSLVQQTRGAQASC